MPTYEIQQVSGIGFTDQNGRKLGRRPNGDYVTCYRYSDGSRNQIFFAYSTDDGVTWTEEQVSFTTEAYDQERPALAVDIDGNVHIVWNGRGWGTNDTVENIQYKKRTTSWGSQEGITDEAESQFSASVAVDSSSIPHVVWRGSFDNGGSPNFTRIQYSNRSSGSWSGAEDIGEGVVGIEDQTLPDLAIDSSNTIHIVWGGKGHGTYGARNQMLYKQGTAGAFGSKELVTDIDADQATGSIAIDSNGDIDLVWSGKGWGTNTTVYNIQYRKRLSGVWQTQEAITDAGGQGKGDASASLETGDSLNVVWRSGTTGTVIIRHRRRSSGSWGSTTTVITRTDKIQDLPSMVGAFHPRNQATPSAGYVFVWAGETAAGDTIEFYEDAAVAWKPTIPANALVRVTAQVIHWSAGPGAVYQTEILTGGLFSQYFSPISSQKEPEPTLQERGPARQLPGPIPTLREYGQWLATHTQAEQRAILRGIPGADVLTLRVWQDWVLGQRAMGKEI
ncbi:hypothetical protein LCGC14_1250750 [marine sediment metagenome]|uniref:Sialidase domain-containing protein n=1 Tax=marine sediment metagenome TaxID=412755 RepID=A0A0F9NKA5_9ZZZZ